eukprot:g3559.t1
MKEPSIVKKYRQIPQSHIDSFNYFLDEGIHRVIAHLPTIEIEHPVTKKIYEISISNPTIGRPMHINPSDGKPIYPRECREMRSSYVAPIEADILIGRLYTSRRICNLPIMVKSKACNLYGMHQMDMIKRGEEANDFGGYFVAGGLDKIIRTLFTQKRHHIMAKDRQNFSKFGPKFTSKVTNIRCVREDEMGRSVSCHYQTSGVVSVGFSVGFNNFFLPAGVLLRALKEVTLSLFFTLTLFKRSKEEDSQESSFFESFVAQNAEATLHELHRVRLETQMECIEYLGSNFRAPMNSRRWKSNYEVGVEFLNEYIFCHLISWKKKFDLLIQMIHKLYAFVSEKCCEDSSDSLSNQEAMPSGLIFMKIFADSIRQFLAQIQLSIERTLEKKSDTFDMEDLEAIEKLLARVLDPSRRLLHMLKTGRFVCAHTRDVGQETGLSIIAERINFLRYLSHFRSIHRGSMYTQMRSTKPRKLLPDSWGFVCPVHTPDGPPCGLLLHLTADCQISIPSGDQRESRVKVISDFLIGSGMIPSSAEMPCPSSAAYISVIIDGEVTGHLSNELIPGILDRFRLVKALNNIRDRFPDAKLFEDVRVLDSVEMQIPFDVELTYFPPINGEPYPGLIISTQAGRLIRSVKQVLTDLEEWIGPQEQLNLNIKSPGSETELSSSELDQFSHEELHSGSFLSILASLTPFSDFNQSPRNMYQCQMAKQTMGTPCHDFDYRPDTKLYRLSTPQKPICRSKKYMEYELNEYPSGTNAVVAVLAYTGYDMEDAMILNQASVDRGFAHDKLTENQVFLSKTTPAVQKSFFQAQQDQLISTSLPRNIASPSTSPAVMRYGVAASRDYQDAVHIDIDGLPHIGAIIRPRQNLYCTFDQVTKEFHSKKLDGDETAFVEQIGIVNNTGKPGLSCANLKLRFERRPIIGDKFASRAGQKGILSTLWTDNDFPFCSSSGMRPDLIINPNAFPSRMTIGMLIESLTAKSGALSGEFVDCSPFQQCDNPEAENVVQYCGRHLMRHGFHHYGTESMISGITVYYQRLRHMVSDKHQCRSIGPVNQMTNQPVQGRKVGGGIRLGEMERDAILSHGGSFVLNDRLCLSCDRSIALACSRCRSLIGPHTKQKILPEIEARMFKRLGASGKAMTYVVCPICGNATDSIIQSPVPKVLQLLAAELCAMNVFLTGIPDIANKHRE